MKNVMCVFLSIVMLVSLTACGGDQAVCVDLQAVKTDILTQLSITDPIELSDDKLLSLYGIPADSMASQACFLVTSDIFPAEILMIEAVDANAADDIAVKLQMRLDSLKVQSQSYDAESYAIAQACTVLADGMYVAMFFSEYGAEMEAIYNSYF